ncbi:MAG: GTPase Era [Acidobacteriota bacterium]|nr:GTPase Era [Acidobacteriota bacterium]
MARKVKSQEPEVESQPNQDFERLLGDFLDKSSGGQPEKTTSEDQQSAIPEQQSEYRSGYAALIGRPNAGKSTLLNHLVGEKIAAVSNKPQTTRHRIQGIVTRPEGQIVFVDTPGIHKPGHLLNRRMMAMVHDALASVDVVCLMRDAAAPTGNGDRFVLDLIKQSEKPAILVLNKIDKVREKGKLLPLIDWYSKEYDWQEVIPISALKGEAVDLLLAQIARHLPVAEKIFSEDELTDQPVRQIVAEMVREKILESTGEEIPYETAVVTEMFDETDPNLTKIYCAIFVERSSQKAIIIGKGGAKLKQIGTEARRDIEKLIGKRVYLQLFVKVEEDWRNRPTALNEMGINK